MKKLSILITAVFFFVAMGCSKKEDPGAEKDKPAKEKAEEKEDEKVADKSDTEKPAEATKEDEEPKTAEADGEEGEAEEKSEAEAVISEMEGTLEIRKAGEGEFKPAAKEMEVFAGDTVRAGNDGSATLALWDNSSVVMAPQSAVFIETTGTVSAPSVTATVLAGAVQLDVPARTAEQGPFLVYAPSSVTAVQGTVLNAAVALNGTSRIGVEEGEVEVTATAKPEAAVIKVPNGKYVEIEVNKDTGKIEGYNPADSDWDQWLETTDSQAAQAAPKVAEEHQKRIEDLKKTFETLESQLETLGKKAEDLTNKVEKAGEEKKEAEYKAAQPELETNIENIDALNHGREAMRSRIAAHAYLLALMQARMNAGVYKVPQASVQAVAAKMAAVDNTLPAGWYRGQRYRARRRRMRRLRRAYYIHHPHGRTLAPKVGVEIPAFYAGVKLRKRPRRARARRRVPGVRVSFYRPPRYRGRRIKESSISRPGRKRPRGWYKDQQWKKRQAKREAKNRARRKRWKNRVVVKRRKRWAKRPKVKIRRRPVARRRGRRMRPPAVGRGVRRPDVHHGRGRIAQPHKDKGLRRRPDVGGMKGHRGAGKEKLRPVRGDKRRVRPGRKPPIRGRGRGKAKPDLRRRRRGAPPPRKGVRFRRKSKSPRPD